MSDILVISKQEFTAALKAEMLPLYEKISELSRMIGARPEGLPVLIGRQDAAKIIRKTPNSVDAWAERNGVKILSKAEAQTLVRGGQAVATKQGKPVRDATACDYYFFESEVRRAFEGRLH